MNTATVPRLASLLAAALIFVMSGCDSERRERTDVPQILELHILEAYADGSERALLQRPQPTMHDVLERIWAAAQNENAKGLLLRLGPLTGAWGRVGDLTEALNDFRETGRPLHCHFDSADNVSYILLAHACDRISMTPAGNLNLIGPAAVMVYARSLLDKLGVEAELLHMGRYKGAGDIFLRNDMPPEAKESMDAILDDLYASLLTATKTRTNDDLQAAKALIDQGPFISSKALEAGLVDEVGFLSDARTKIRQAAGIDEIREVRMMPKAEEITLRDFLSLLGGSKPERQARGERIALVYVSGNIVERDLPSVGEAASGPFVRVMKRLAEDEDVKAVVLRINSPGGSALASDQMWHAAHELAQVKPLYASVGDMAASGGYYIASAAQKLVAHPNSLVGSIGVVGGKINVATLAEELGINTFVLQRGERAAWMTPLRRWEPTERQAFETMLRDTYERFIDRVATGRKMDPTQVRKGAEGRVMTARAAKTLGLVDELAGLGKTLALAREAAGLGDAAQIEVWPAKKDIFDTIAEVLGGSEDVQELISHESLQERALGALLPLDPWPGAALILAREGVALVPPFSLAVR